ncbi:MAG: tagaturonate reductase [Clostridia bacterium]|nr:tagaturonate reductase [Clostridia bacterium]
MKNLNRKSMNLVNDYPEKVLMFGEGNFLRAFACFIIDKLNRKGYGGYVTALQGIEKGLCNIINAQDGLYTVIERGMEKGNITERFNIISCLKRCVNPYTDYNAYLSMAENPDLQVVISNTTEFGICYAENEDKDRLIHKNFPAKLTHLLYNRYKFFGGDSGKGLVILPCELIDKNGDKLKEIVFRYAHEWGLESGFTDWLCGANIFANTLVDRIVSGYPKNEAKQLCQKIGYYDDLLDVCEPFLLWVIEGDKKILDILPLYGCGLDIVITDDLTPYRTRKVRILNGAHTMSVLAGHICGFETVEQLVNDKVFNKFMINGIFEEIIPSFEGDKLAEYANDVIERFKNPYLNHKLLSISLNSVSKFKTRVLPSIKDYIKKYDKAPRLLSFSLAALIEFYKRGIGKFVSDEKQYLDVLSDIFGAGLSEGQTVKAVLGSELLWGEDLTAIKHLEKSVADCYSLINKKTMAQAVKEIL